MGYLAPTSAVGLVLADPLTVQAFETTNVNSNFTKIENGFVADRARITSAEKQFLRASSDADRLSKVPTPTQGDQVFRTDKQYVERYYDAYNVTTNPDGARVAGWFPAPGSDIFFRTQRKAGQIIAANTDTVLSNNTVFDAPVSSKPMPLTGSVFENDFFKWDTTAGTIALKVEGRYDIEARVNWENTAAFTIVHFSKNQAVISGAVVANVLALDEKAGNTSNTTTAVAAMKDVPVLTTDLLRLLVRANAALQANFSAIPAAASIHIRYAGVIHA